MSLCSTSICCYVSSVCDILYCLCRDAKNYAKYSTVDYEIDQKACEDLILGETSMAKDEKIMFKDLIKEHRASLASDEVMIVYVFSSGYFEL